MTEPPQPDGQPSINITVNGDRGPSRTSAATQARMRGKALRLIEELTPRLSALEDDELTALLLTVFDVTADRAQAYAEGQQS